MAQSTDVDYDANDDGLIEVGSLKQLHATRWDPDGDGDPIAANADDYALAFPTPATGMGCVLTDHDSDANSADQPTCIGYEADGGPELRHRRQRGRQLWRYLLGRRRGLGAHRFRQ